MEISSKLDQYYGEIYSCEFYKVAVTKMFSQNHLKHIEVNHGINLNLQIHLFIIDLMNIEFLLH